MEIIKLTYNPQFNDLRESSTKNIFGKLENLQHFLFADKGFSTDLTKFLVGNKTSLADVNLVVLLDLVLKLDQEALEKLEKLSAFRKQFHQIPNYKAYCASDRRSKTSNAVFAQFGAKPEESQQGDE